MHNTAVGRRCWKGKLLLCWQCIEYQFLRLFLDCSDSTKFQFVFSHLFLWSCFEACPLYLYCHQQLFSCYMYEEKDESPEYGAQQRSYQWSSNTYALLTKFKVRMAGYNLAIGFGIFCGPTLSRGQEKVLKKNEANIVALLTDQPWSIKDLLMWFGEVHSCRTNVANSKWAIQGCQTVLVTTDIASYFHSPAN